MRTFYYFAASRFLLLEIDSDVSIYKTCTRYRLLCLDVKVDELLQLLLILYRTIFSIFFICTNSLMN